MASIVVSGDTSGAITISAPATAGTNTLSLPANTGTAILDYSTPAYRNRIINGAMVIDQRNAGASKTITDTVNSTYTLDRWQAYGSVASKFSVQQNAGSVTPPTGYKNYLGVTSLATTSLGANDQYYVGQYIEGYNVADFGFGAAGAATFTISFWVRSSLTGTFGGSVANSAFNRSYPFTYTINSANTWEQKTVTIAGDTTGTWLTTNGTGLQVNFGLGVGTSLSGTANSWAAAAYVSATGATSVVGTNGATFYITGVQLEKGSTATSFDYRPYGTELALCQRYLPYIGGIGGNQSFGQCYANTTTTLRAVINFPVQARVYPTGLVTSTASGFVGQMQGSSNLTASALAVTSIAGLTSTLIELTVSGATAGQPGSIYNASAGYMYFTGCEL